MAERILGPKRSKVRRRHELLLLSLTAAVFTVFFVSGASGVLSGSTFDSANGKLDPTTVAHDWNHPVEPIACGTAIPSSGTNCGLDLVKDAGDNALGQGSKEDETSVQVVDGSIPPSKDDLSRFYLNHEKVGAVDYLYLAWERSNLLGSAHLDFELNKNPVGLTATTAPGTITLNRTAGDKLIDFDYELLVHTGGNDRDDRLQPEGQRHDGVRASVDTGHLPGVRQRPGEWEQQRRRDGAGELGPDERNL